MSPRFAVAIAVLSALPPAFAQAPVIAGGGVQNAATNTALVSIEPLVLVAIKGENLASSTASASGFPLPTALGGTTVTFNGAHGPLLAPLFYASPTQINAQVPNGIDGATMVITTAAGSSAPYNLPAMPASFPRVASPLGIFTEDGTGCGQAVAFNIPSDGSPLSENTPQNSFDPDKDLGLAIFLTGLGSPDFPDRSDGVPWIYNSADNLLAGLNSAGIQAVVTLGAAGLTGTFTGPTFQYLGPAPEKVAVDQANVLGPWQGTPHGCRVPLSLQLLQPQTAYTYATLPGAALDSTQLVDVSIQPGGGACSDPTPDGLGILTWQKSVVSAAQGGSSTEAVTAQFIDTNELGYAQPGPFPQPLPTLASPQSTAYGPVPFATPACNASLPNTLNAGGLTLSGPNFGPVVMAPSTQDGRLTYQATLQPGTLQGGTYRVSGNGGSQVGAFTTTASIPAPITITTNLQPGTQLQEVVSLGFGVPGAEGVWASFPIQWTGGDDRSIVTVQLVVGAFEAVAAAYGGSGAVDIAYITPCNAISITPIECTLIPQGMPEVIITQTPLHAPSQPFNAPGLPWGGEGTWKYVWDFRGLASL